MKVANAQLFTGRKGVRLEDLPEEAWTILSGAGGKDEAAKLYAYVAWLYRCVAIRANAVASMPWQLLKNDTIVASDSEKIPANIQWLNGLPSLLYKTESALVLSGSAYWFKEQNAVRVLGLQYIRPDSIKPTITAEGLKGFVRSLGSDKYKLDIEDLVYFWLPDPFVELGPAENYPAKAALSSASVLNSLDLFLTNYFDRGMIKATLLKYTQPMANDERQRVKDWWQRVATGIKNSFGAEVVRGDFEPLIIGDGVADLSNSILTKEQRESVATALGVPQSKASANAANFATKQSDDLSFIVDTIIPECRFIGETMNRQLFEPMGLWFEFLPDSLSIMQEDEKQRAASLKLLVDSGVPLEVALDILGYDIPTGIEVRSTLSVASNANIPPANEKQETSPAEEREIEVRRFTRWAKRRKSPDINSFDSDILSDNDKLALLQRLQNEENGGGQMAIDAPFRHWQKYP